MAETRKQFLEDMDERLASSPQYARFVPARTVNCAAIAYVLGIDSRQVPKLMSGYRAHPIGKSTHYDKNDVWDAWRKDGVLTA